MRDKPSRMSAHFKKLTFTVSRTSQQLEMYFLSVFSQQRVTCLSLCRSKLDFRFSEYLMKQSSVYNMTTEVLTWQDTLACWGTDE